MNLGMDSSPLRSLLYFYYVPESSARRGIARVTLRAELFFRDEYKNEIRRGEGRVRRVQGGQGAELKEETRKGTKEY